MSAAASRRAPADRSRLSLARLLLLPLVAFAIAVALQAALQASGLPAASPLRVFATPAIAAAVVFYGLRPYPTAGRLRQAAMVAAGLLLVALLM